MAASYTTELEALNALYDLLDTVSADVIATKTDVATIKTYTDTVETKLETIGNGVGTTNGHLSTMKEQLGTSNNLQTAANALLDELRGATTDVRNIPTDACIIRVYVGDQTAKREKASEQIEKLLTDGYRPYMVMGISEDLARVLFVKYPEPNESKHPIALPDAP